MAQTHTYISAFITLCCVKKDDILGLLPVIMHYILSTTDGQCKREPLQCGTLSHCWLISSWASSIQRNNGSIDVMR